jgi:hypothetical protein
MLFQLGNPAAVFLRVMNPKYGYKEYTIQVEQLRVSYTTLVMGIL